MFAGICHNDPQRRLPPLWAALVAAALCLPVLGGCVGYFAPSDPPLGPPIPMASTNPLLVPCMDRDLVWEQLVDVMDDYFKVEREERVRLSGDLLTEGRLDTYPRTGSTLLEPWNNDSVNNYERLESTLQSIRRRAIVRVIPAQGGFLVDMTVLKELEDVPRPENATASWMNLRNDNSLRRYSDPVTGQQPTLGWIGIGRDVALEQTILAQLQSRFPVGAAVAAAP